MRNMVVMRTHWTGNEQKKTVTEFRGKVKRPTEDVSVDRTGPTTSLKLLLEKVERLSREELVEESDCPVSAVDSPGGS
jgi:hypothetical protein